MPCVANCGRDAILKKMLIDSPVECDKVGARQTLKIGAPQVRRRGLDIVQDRKEPFATFHLLELLASEETCESVRHLAYGDELTAVWGHKSRRHIIRGTIVLTRPVWGVVSREKTGT